MKKYTESKIVSLLSTKKDCKINGRSVQINIGITDKGKNQKQHDLGIGSWGKIDFLTRHCGYGIIYLPEF